MNALAFMGASVVAAVVLTSLVFTTHIIPGIRAECELRVVRATTTEQARQRESVRAAIVAFENAQAQIQAAADARLAAREQELMQHERDRTAQGRACPLDGGDIDWLRAR
jgi:quinolinate synthase